MRVKLNYTWPVEMNWIPARPTLFRAELFGGFVAVVQVFMQHLRSINARSHTRIDTAVPPKAIRALYFRHFLRPTLAGTPYCELALHLDCQYSNGNNANNVDRFFIANEWRARQCYCVKQDDFHLFLMTISRRISYWMKLIITMARVYMADLSRQ